MIYQLSWQHKDTGKIHRGLECCFDVSGEFGDDFHDQSLSFQVNMAKICHPIPIDLQKTVDWLLCDENSPHFDTAIANSLNAL